MKAPILQAFLILSCLCPAGFCQEVRDVRKANGVLVDLTPVRQWLRDRKGERPMKHWKVLEVTEIKEAVGSLQKCTVKNESGDSLELLIQNLPGSIPKHFAEIKQRRQQLDWLNASLAQGSAAVARADVTTPRAAIGRSEFVESVMTERYKIELAKLSLAERKTKAASLREELNQLTAQRQSELAMFSGRKYGGLEIWDCGQPVK